MIPKMLNVLCRCCGKPLRVPEEDACDLCLVCYRGKRGDTDEPCRAHKNASQAREGGGRDDH